MEEVFKEWIKWMGVNYPEILITLGVIIFIVYFLKEIKVLFFDVDSDGLTFGTKLKYFFMFWKKRSTKDKKFKQPKNVVYTDEEREEVTNELLIHNLFIKIAEIKTKIPGMDFGYPKKSAVFRDIIRIYVETIEKYAINFIKNNSLDKMTTTQLNEALALEIEKISFEIYSKMRARLGDVLYEKLIEDPVKGFKVRNAPFREVFIDGILSLSSQAMAVYKYDNYRRAREILTSMYISLQTVVGNFYKVYKDYNGELDKYLL